MSARVLLADDDDAVRDELTELLEERGYTVVTAATLDDTAVALREQPLDVALLDAWLGGRSLVDWLEESGAAQRVPVVLLSGVANLDEVLRGLAVGARDFVHKSDPPERLLMALGDALAQGVGAEATPSLVDVEERGEVDPRSIFQALVDGTLRCVVEVHQHAERHVLFADVHPPAPLSPRQQHVLRALLARSPIKAVARDLGVSEATVWSEIGALQRTLGFRDRHQMLRVLGPLAIGLGEDA